MPKKSDSEKSQEEDPTVGFGTLGTMVFQLLALLSSVVRGGQVHRQPSPSFPPSNKFSLGDDSRRWAADAQEYVELFIPSDRRRVLFSLLEGEAKEHEAFKELRERLCTTPIPGLIDYGILQFHEMRRVSLLVNTRNTEVCDKDMRTMIFLEQ
ncbi:unnamed protein product [Echinostoma caproni]|uniref:Transmembrane protein n=1 Tax=Echinostoma caproni TaxID=27848 RepID=A0A183AHL2_9TREM|nr:unnamed protein product [Echinostoma caproni]